MRPDGPTGAARLVSILTVSTVKPGGMNPSSSTVCPEIIGSISSSLRLSGLGIPAEALMFVDDSCTARLPPPPTALRTCSAKDHSLDSTGYDLDWMTPPVFLAAVLREAPARRLHDSFDRCVRWGHEAYDSNSDAMPRPLPVSSRYVHGRFRLVQPKQPGLDCRHVGVDEPGVKKTLATFQPYNVPADSAVLLVHSMTRALPNMSFLLTPHPHQ